MSHKWDDSIFIPSHIWVNLLNKELESLISNRFKLDLTLQHNRTALLASLMSITSWRYSQGCYILNNDLLPIFFNSTIGSMVSVNHYNNLNEWTACIPVQNTPLEGDELFCFYVHKNFISTPTEKVPCLVLTFNLNKETGPLKAIPLPYVILNYSKDNCIENAIIDFGGLKATNPREVATLIAPYLSLFNAIFDKTTVIESDIVGVKKPHYKEIDSNINFNEFNLPTVKYLAPSNIRIWNAGTNHLAKLRQLSRKDPDNKHVVEWVFDKHLTISYR